jgi:Holliday junction resolvase RusA-like endonuclease
MTVKFTIIGPPMGKGRPRFVGKGQHPITPQKTVKYENRVIMEYERQVGADSKFQAGQPLDMRIMAYFQVPESGSKRDRARKLDGLIRPTKKPDIDNIAKIIADSLNEIAYHDDTQIVDMQVRKFYSTQPRVEVIIQPVTYEGSKST